MQEKKGQDPYQHPSGDQSTEKSTFLRNSETFLPWRDGKMRERLIEGGDTVGLREQKNERTLHVLSI